LWVSHNSSLVDLYAKCCSAQDAWNICSKNFVRMFVIILDWVSIDIAYNFPKLSKWQWCDERLHMGRWKINTITIGWQKT
jgi:hypothetical protein